MEKYLLDWQLDAKILQSKFINPISIFTSAEVPEGGALVAAGVASDFGARITK